MKISLLAYVATFSGVLYFRRSYCFTILQRTTSAQQLPFRSSHFFRAAAFLRSSFYGTATSWMQLLNSFRAKLLPSSHFLRIGSSLEQLLFGTANFLAEELFRIKICIEELLFRSWYFCTASAFSEELYLGKS